MPYLPPSIFFRDLKEKNNVPNTLTEIFKDLKKILDSFIFEPINAKTLQSFKNKVNDYLCNLVWWGYLNNEDTKIFKANANNINNTIETNLDKILERINIKSKTFSGGFEEEPE
jgi:hypothetical protein